METKKTKILAIVALVALALTVVTATYAYFQAQVGDPAAVNVSVTANTVDTFTFSTGNAISISLDQDNFGTGKGNQVGSTTASATLTANSKTNTATEHYYLYLSIPENTYTYSIDENTPEIILTVTDASGSAVEISGLTPVTATGANVTSVTGYDITNKSGLITILNNREITTTSSTTEKWNITITFINYDKDQSDNAGKSMSAKVIIQKDPMPLHETCNDDTLACYIAKKYTGTQGENNIYYHDGTITSKSEFTVSAFDENMNKVEKTYPVGTVLDANDGSYRYAGASSSVNNYVCFGIDEDECPTDNLYRIIGVFGDQVKLIKADYANSNLLGTDGSYWSYYTYAKSSYSGYTGAFDTVNSYSWNNVDSNAWSESSLNTVNLNTNFFNSFGKTWKDKIATTAWKVGDNTENISKINTIIPASAYKYEIIEPERTYQDEIGLMYVSDYLYGASPSAWTLIGWFNDSTKDYRAATNINWMYMGIYEWTISEIYSTSVGSAFVVNSNGSIFNGNNGTGVFAVRPTFYLTSDVTYSSGTGTSSDPIRLGV